MIRRARTLGLLVMAVLIGLSAPGLADFRDGTVNISDLSANPAASNYSPYAWTSVWNPSKTDYVELQAGEPKKGLIDTGLVIGNGDQSEQWSALTPAEQAQVAAQWSGGLIKSVWTMAMEFKKAAHAAAAGDSVYEAPPWSTDNANDAAVMLGGTDYASLSPGLKSIVQRIAVIVTGDTKPPMPDDEWQLWMPAATKADYDALAATRYNWERNIAFNVEVGPEDVQDTCDPNFPVSVTAFCQTVLAAEDVAETAGEIVSFGSDPVGWLNQKMAEGASSVFEWVATTANDATMPDLTSDWWISAYQKGFAAGIVIFFMVLMWQFVRLARGRTSSAEVLDALVARTPAFFAGMVFGPPLAQFFIVGAGQLTNDIVSGMTGGTGEATQAILAAISSAGEGSILGGPLAALIILLVLLIACFFIFITLCAQTIAIYISGAVFGVAFAWIADARRTSGSMRVPLLFLGLVFSRPLLFFLLAAGMGLVKDGFGGQGSAAQQLGTLVMAVVLLATVALSPLLLLQLAPVIPTGGEGTGGMSSGGMPGLRTGGGSSASSAAPAAATGAGAAAGGGSALQQLARPSAVPIGGAAAAASGPAQTGAVPGASSGAKPSAMSTAAAGSSPGSSQVTPSARGGGGSSSPAGRQLGRSRRHGGGTPSAAAAAMLAGGGPPTASAASGRGAGRGLGSLVRVGAHKAKKPLGDTAHGVQGSKPW